MLAKTCFRPYGIRPYLAQQTNIINTISRLGSFPRFKKKLVVLFQFKSTLALICHRAHFHHSSNMYISPSLGCLPLERLTSYGLQVVISGPSVVLDSADMSRLYVGPYLPRCITSIYAFFHPDVCHSVAICHV